ncbi:MAG: hypothetical protein HSCHL_0295 [Hydrogenibacillus schlegelii]|uniref:Uncharacterized protein n=1 Tax=Hydrogenibacillus schlegelii TaxID=1484 RepID=A0A2T5GDV4_HYDSH|nr:MAG: hypothetical protein HSCHL_0295 [Hydrogenibacillus schlegelii]
MTQEDRKVPATRRAEPLPADAVEPVDRRGCRLREGTRCKGFQSSKAARCGRSAKERSAKERSAKERSAKERSAKETEGTIAAKQKAGRETPQRLIPSISDC